MEKDTTIDGGSLLHYQWLFIKVAAPPREPNDITLPHIVSAWLGSSPQLAITTKIICIDNTLRGTNSIFRMHSFGINAACF